MQAFHLMKAAGHLSSFKLNATTLFTELSTNKRPNE
jgi:hypothetical protein